MKSYFKCTLFLILIMVLSLCLVSCTKGKKQGKVIITEQEFSIQQDTEINWVINAKGKIRNVGEVDVKKVVVTGYCRSCQEVLNAGRWTIVDYAKTSEQKDMIGYLTAGDEAEFNFKEVAFYFHQSGRSPESLPESLEMVIESFETVE